MKTVVCLESVKTKRRVGEWSDFAFRSIIINKLTRTQRGVFQAESFRFKICGIVGGKVLKKTEKRSAKKEFLTGPTRRVKRQADAELLAVRS